MPYRGGPRPGGTLLMVPVAKSSKVIAINLKGVWLGLKAVIPQRTWATAATRRDEFGGVREQLGRRPLASSKEHLHTSDPVRQRMGTRAA